MVKIEIIQNHGKYRVGQVVGMDEFDMGHALAFKYGKIFVQPQRPTEMAVEVVPEVREVEKSFFKRRGRKAKV